MGRGRMTSGGGGSRGGMTSGGRGGGWHHHSTVIIGHHHGHYHSSGSPWIGIIVGIIFALVGFIVMCVGFGQISKVYDYSKVTAVCVGNEKNEVDGGYFARYTFVIDGNQYTNVRSNQSWVTKEDINAEVVIYYLEDDPKQIYEECPVSIGEGAMIAGFGLLFGVFGVLPLVLCIKEIKNKKSGDVNIDSQDPSPIKEEHTRCPYCGARYNKTSDSCPKCGASRMY